jgi:hypothetical protein
VTGLFLALAALAAAAAGSEPAAPSAGDAEPARSLRERVQGYWQARLERSPRVYEFYAPAERGGAAVSEGGSVPLTAFEIEAAEVRGDEATVGVRVAAPLGPPAARQTRTLRFREAWHRRDGVWYRRPVPPGFARGAGFPVARVAEQSEPKEELR